MISRTTQSPVLFQMEEGSKKRLLVIGGIVLFSAGCGLAYYAYRKHKCGLPNPKGERRLVPDPCGATNYYQIRTYFEPLGYKICWNPNTRTVRVCHPTCGCSVVFFGPENFHLCPRDNRSYAPQWRLDADLENLRRCRWKVANCTDGGYTC